jgi:fermentation-respiration switch protein FrsA (DUF1100 family)
MGKISFANSNNSAITMAAVINFPEGFDEKRKYPAIVVSHPGGGVKEETAGTYAKKLAERGFVTIAYHASYQGESTGEPRQLENPSVGTEDVSAVIDHLTTLPCIDKDGSERWASAQAPAIRPTPRSTTAASRPSAR